MNERNDRTMIHKDCAQNGRVGKFLKQYEAWLAQKSLELPTLIKFKIITGFPYLLTRFSKCSLVALYVWSFLDTRRKHSKHKVRGMMSNIKYLNIKY